MSRLYIDLIMEKDEFELEVSLTYKSELNSKYICERPESNAN